MTQKNESDRWRKALALLEADVCPYIRTNPYRFHELLKNCDQGVLQLSRSIVSMYLSISSRFRGRCARAYTRSERGRNRGTESLGDLPRPDRLGLVMK
jgi:hypothetical protein